MSTRDAFLADIIEHPQDNAPRLVFADWLDENGEPAWAEFIRVQIELASLEPYDPRRVSLKQRESALSPKVKGRWKAELPKRARWKLEYRRGFPAIVTATADQFLRWGQRLRGLVPLEGAELRRVRRLEELLASGLFAGLTYLNLVGHFTLGDAGARGLAAAADLSALRTLRLYYVDQLTAAGLGAIGASPHLGALTALDVWGGDFGPEGLAALAGSPLMARLRSLELHSTRLGDEAGALLAGSPAAAGLTSVTLSDNAIGPEGARALAGSPSLANLRSLNLQTNRIGVEGARALVDSPALAGLTVLSLFANALGDEGIRALAGCPGLGRLCSLNLGSNGVGDEGAAALANSPHLENLRDLLLGGNSIGAEGARALAESRHLGQLAFLRIFSNKVPPQEVRRLRERFPVVWM